MRIPPELKNKIRCKLKNSFASYSIFYDAGGDAYLSSSYVTFADLIKLNAVLADFNIEVDEIRIKNENEILLELLPTEKWIDAPYIIKCPSRLEALQKITKKTYKPLAMPENITAVDDV